MANCGKFWSTEDEDKMISLLAQTKMSSIDCDTIFARMFGRTPRAIYLRRIQIAQRLLKIGHPEYYVFTLLHLCEEDLDQMSYSI